jgi:hypothetical protein
MNAVSVIERVVRPIHDAIPYPAEELVRKIAEQDAASCVSFVHDQLNDADIAAKFDTDFLESQKATVKYMMGLAEEIGGIKPTLPLGFIKRNTATHELVFVQDDRKFSSPHKNVRYKSVFRVNELMPTEMHFWRFPKDISVSCICTQYIFTVAEMAVPYHDKNISLRPEILPDGVSIRVWKTDSRRITTQYEDIYIGAYGQGCYSRHVWLTTIEKRA